MIQPKVTDAEDRLWALEHPEPPKPIQVVPDRTRITVYPTYDGPVEVVLDGEKWLGAQEYNEWSRADLQRRRPHDWYHWVTPYLQLHDKPSKQQADQMIGAWHASGFARVGDRRIRPPSRPRDQGRDMGGR